MSEKVEHKIIDPDECPRCGGTNTDYLGDDGTPTASYTCRDCERAGLDDACYDIVRSRQISSVNWDDGESYRTVYDTRWFAQGAAMELLEACEGLLEQLTGPVMVHGDGRDGIKTGLSQEEFNALRMSRIAAARAAVSKAKGESHE